MDDSDQDFTDLCSKLLKRVRKKPSESRQPRRAEQQSSSQVVSGDRSGKNNKRTEPTGLKCAWSQPVSAAAETDEAVARGGPGSGDSGGSDVSEAASAGQPEGPGMRAKDKVLLRMQQFKRASPQRMAYTSPTSTHERRGEPPAFSVLRQESLSASPSSEPQDSDEALALRLQQELDREAAESQIVDLEEGGLFFCQICNKDLSHMSPEGRTQHLNRCLDESEQSTQPLPPPPPPPPPGVPDCPICGKKFKSQKSRSAHLKRCSTDLGVSPAELLQAVQRQAEESQNIPSASTSAQTGGTKRKGAPKPTLPANKKPRKKTEPLDEDTMVALALSSSLLEQEKEQNRERDAEIEIRTASHSSMTSGLKWRPDAGAGKGRGKKKKANVPRPPQLLLIQDASTALTRLQDRVSALLLRSRPPSPPTPTRCPSTVPGLVGAAPLWQKSRLLDEGSSCLTDFYTAELREFITPWESRATDAVSSSTLRPESSVKNASEGTPLSKTRASILFSSSQAASSSSSPAPPTPGTGQLPVGSQALRDLMELAEDGMTLTQCGYTASGSNGRAVGKISNLRLSGFVLEESEEQAELCVSGFLPDTTHTRSEDKQNQRRRTTDQSGTETKQSVSLSRLSSDLSSMVNNPQLSDVQLQVDSGDIFFAHSFMLYARCPLLAEMIHESGFGVQEEDLPAAQRVLINDVPAEAVLALLRYLYTAQCSISAPLRPHVLELASRFDLQQLQQICVLHREDMATEGEEEDYLEENINNQTDQALVELLRSMWNDEDVEEEEEEGAEREGNKEEGLEEDGGQADDLIAADVEIQEDKVNEEELEEIYEFAATQRKREDDRESEEEEEVFTKLTEPKRSFTDLKSQSKPDLSLDRSYNRLFSDSWGVYKEGDPSSSQQHGSPLKPSSRLSGRTLLQLSGSEAEEKSPSRPSISSNLPVLDQSPDLAALKRESQGPQSICIPDSPKSCKEMKEPELIVLSDSSEELEDVVCPCSPTPGSHTQIKPQPIQTDKDSSQEPKISSSLQQSPEILPPAQLQSPSAECSPEVSWLIPSTPLQHIRSMSSSSTQTRSSMCRTRLFPKRDASSSNVFSSPALPSKNSLADSISWIKQEENEPFNSELDLKISSKQASRCDVSQDQDVCTVPSSQTKAPSSLVSASSKQDILQPHSSTPLHTDLHLPQVYPAASPLINSISKKACTSKDMELLGSPEKMELESFHLSPLSDPSSSHRGLQDLQKHSSESSRQSQSSGGSNMNKNTDSELRGEDKEGDINGAEAGEAVVETNEADFSFQQSFMDMDEPPIAFNDSWGLDACVENPGRFSLRLEDSRGSSQKDRSQEGRETARSSTSSDFQPPPAALSLQSPKSHSRVGDRSPSKPAAPSTPETNSLLDSKIWDSWREEEDEEALPLSQRLNPSAQLRTPAVSKLSKSRRTLVPITPMPHYSDMDTPELKTKLNRFGVRPLPKRQMILKLKEIHQYTHQLVSSDSDGDSPSVGRAAPAKPPAAGSRPPSCAQTVRFKEPRAPAVTSPLKHVREEEGEPLSASQGSNTSSTAESERSNPELCASSDGDSDSDGGISASQTASRLQDRLQAVRSFILSDSSLYTQILQYQPLVLSQLQQRLKAAGIRLGAAKLVDYLDSQCITFTTAKPGQPAPSRRRGKKTKAAGEGRKKVVSAML